MDTSPPQRPASAAEPSPDSGRRFDWLHMVLLAAVAILLTAGIAW